MSKQQGDYIRLAKGRPFLSNSVLGEIFSLWLGKDHLLLVCREQYTETYKRFFFKDIQALVLLRTRASTVYNLILGSVASLLGIAVVLGLVEHWEPAATVAVIVLETITMIAFVVNLWRGPSCQCHILTSVQTERIHTLTRLKSATKVVNTIRDAVERVQGSLSSGQATRSWMDKMNADSTAPSEPPYATAQQKPLYAIPVPGKPMIYYNGWAHMIIFSCLLVDFVDTCMEWFMKNGLLGTEISITLLLILFIHLVIGLVKQHKSRVTRDLKITTWITLGYYVSIILLIAGSSWYVLISSGDTEIMSGIESPADSLVALGLNILCMTGSGILGCFGWIETVRSRRQQRTPPALPASPPLPVMTLRAVDKSE